MLLKGIVDREQLLDPLLGVVTVTFDDHKRAREFFHHLGFPRLQLFLAPAQFFEFPLLPLDDFLLPLDLKLLFLRFLNLRIEMFTRRLVFFCREIEKLFVVTRAFRHGDWARG
jgi:hypothetical protein